MEPHFSSHQFHSLGGMRMANGCQLCEFVCVCVVDWREAAEETGDTCLRQTKSRLTEKMRVGHWGFVWMIFILFFPPKYRKS